MGCKVWDPVRGSLGLQGGGLAGCRPRGVAQRVFERVSKASASLNRQQSQRMAAERDYSKDGEPLDVEKRVDLAVTTVTELKETVLPV